jgi:hypothetical protein
MIAKDELRQARYDQACWWLAQGVAIVPLKPNSKQLQPGYGSRKAQITQATFAAQWFLNTDANLGLVLGGTTDLVVADWDVSQSYQTWLETTGQGVETLTEQTARGYHSFFIAQGLPSLTGHGCEFKTRGVCMVSPSRHPSGVVYRIVNNLPIFTIDEEKMRTLFPFLSENLPRQIPNEDKISLLNQASSKETKGLPVRVGVIARIKATRSIVAEMRTTGVKLQSGGKHTLVGLCPFHKDHSPSLWVNPQSGLWGCNKPTCPAAGTHDVINFRALSRSISNNAAVKQLANEFL